MSSNLTFGSKVTMNEPREHYPYLHVGRASDLQGSDRVLYKALEILPAALSVSTLLALVALSFFAPRIAAYFTIFFSGYWLFKTLFLSAHLRHNFRRLRHNMLVDWQARLENMKYHDVRHVVIFPFYKEPYEVVHASLQALAESRFDTKRIAVVLAAEERAGSPALVIAERAKTEFAQHFLDFVVTVHPGDMPGEMPGKGSNISYAAEESRRRILDVRGIAYKDAIVSAFDIDTVVYPDYFGCLTWHFMTAERPERVSFQPVPLYNNNIWSAPTLSRVLAYSSTYWQMIQQERPERLSTFSSHAVSMQALVEAGYWQRNMVSEDSRIYWNLFMRYDGDYAVVPISYPVSMDANVAPTFWGTVRNLYKQHRRWSYGAENLPYMIFNFIKNPRIPLRKKLYNAFTQLEGFWSLVTHPLILFSVGWLPLIIGGHEFNATVLSYNLPIVARWFLTLAMVGLITCSLYFMYLIPPRPKEYPWHKNVLMTVQWILVPFTMVFFSSIPGLEAQLRLATGWYLGFWVTPKERALRSVRV